MRIVDVLLAIPGILLAIGIVAWLDRGLLQIMFAVADHERADLRADPARQHAVAARVRLRDRRPLDGCIDPRLLLRHMLPNALTPIIVASTLALATAIIDVAGLGFLGLGPPDPRTAEWGTMLTGATQLLPAGAVDASSSPAPRSRSARSASTCSVTACANRSTRG